MLVFAVSHWKMITALTSDVDNNLQDFGLMVAEWGITIELCHTLKVSHYSFLMHSN